MNKQMTPKEALKGIKQAIAEHLHLRTGVSVEKHFEYLQYDTEIDIVDKALTKLEELNRDVARYFELQYKNQFDHITLNEIHEMYVLREKLSKVGKEE